MTQYVCPRCGCPGIEEVQVEATVTSVVLSVDEDGSIDYGPCAHDDGEFRRFQCRQCGQELPGVRTGEALYACLHGAPYVEDGQQPPYGATIRSTQSSRADDAPAPVASTFVQTVTVRDPDTGLPVEVEIRKLASGPMLGLDAAYLAQLGDDEQPHSPYDPDTRVIVPLDQ